MNKLGLAAAALALLAASLASCALAVGTQNAATSLSASDLSSLQSSYMASYYADSSGSPGGVSSIRALTPFSVSSASGAKATVPSDRYTFTFSSLPQSISNYPEPGQTTSFTANLYDAASYVYRIEATTSYPSSDTRESYLEVYYVADSDHDGIWDSGEGVVSGTLGGTWSSAPAARVSMTLSYRDGSSRSEQIYSSTAASGPYYDYAALSPDGTLDLLGITAAPATTSDVQIKFSSVVVYTYQPARDSRSFWFWKGKNNAGIIGVRYYTEYADAANSKYVGRSAAYEKIIGSFGGYSVSSPAAIVSAIYGSVSNTLGSSVVRQEVQYALNGAGTGASGSALSSRTRMQTRISDFVNSWDYLLNQDNTNTVSLGSTVAW